MDLPTYSFFIAEIVNICTEAEFLSEGKPDMKKIGPFLLKMADNNFWAIGESLGKAWSAGKNYDKSRNYGITMLYALTGIPLRFIPAGDGPIGPPDNSIEKSSVARPCQTFVTITKGEST